MRAKKKSKTKVPVNYFVFKTRHNFGFCLEGKDEAKADTEAEEFVSEDLDEKEAASESEGDNLCQIIESTKFVLKTVVEEISEPGLSEAEGDISTYEAISSVLTDEEGKMLCVCIFLKVTVIIIKFQKHMEKNYLRNCSKEYRKVKKYLFLEFQLKKFHRVLGIYVFCWFFSFLRF